MFANSYAGIVKPEIPRLISSRARRMHVGRDDIEDLQQQIVPLLAKFQFDPARANGATLTTAMTGVIDRQIKSYLRSQRRYRQRVEQVGQSTDELDQPRQHAPSVGELELRLDVQASVSHLSPRDQTICLALAEGENVSAISRQLHVSRDCVAAAIRRIRRTFAMAGLGTPLRA